MNSQGKNFLISMLVVLILPGLVIYVIFSFYGKRLDQHAPVNIEFSADHVSSTDHSEFDILRKDFKSPNEVTEACISCHTGRDDEIMASAHWKWEREVEIPGREGTVSIGKKNLINNFCTGAAGNNGSCMRCHIGLGWEDKSFDFADSRNVDCLVCHDRTETYL
ncbi:MAG: hypothetical protein KAK04_04925, partial [Cyclobacteriaceae bacterium]|nr:hypothetical protein [Cyclobacteriaceae bacterium]